MKWIGWIFTIGLIVILILVRHGGVKQVEEERVRLESRVADEQAKVDEVFARAEAGIPTRRERLQSETRKTEELEAQRDELSAKKAKLQARAGQLTKQTEHLREAKSDLAGTKQQNLEEIRELQEQVTKLEKQNELLGEALKMVSPKKDF